MKSKQRLFFYFLLFLFLLATRFLFLERSARFIWDESGDLVNMWRIYHDRKVTLIGPISQNKINIYGSLTYYMLLPFTVLFNFDPLGPAVGDAVYGIIGVLLLSFLVAYWFNWQYWVPLVFLTFFFPLVQSGRWAWNPNLVPFWLILSLLSFYSAHELGKKQKLLFLLSGFLSSLAIHNHWYAAFTVLGTIFASFWLLRPRNLSLWYTLGVFGGILPFIIFDLTHPPGLFLTRMIYFSPVSPAKGGGDFIGVGKRLPSVVFDFFLYLTQNKFLALLILGVWFIYCGWLLRGNKWVLFFLTPLIFLWLGLSLIGGEVYSHYYLSGVPFYVLTVFYKKEEWEKWRKRVQLFIIFFAILASIPFSLREILKNQWDTNIRATRQIVEIIYNDLSPEGGKLSNIVVLASPDPNTKGKRYRDLLRIRGVQILPEDNYRDNNRLYVISSSSVGEVKKSKAYEIDRVRDKNPTKIWKIGGSIWWVYRFDI